MNKNHGGGEISPYGIISFLKMYKMLHDFPQCFSYPIIYDYELPGILGKKPLTFAVGY